MVEVDRKLHLESVVRREARVFVAVAHLDRPFDPDEALGTVLLFHTCRLHQEHERPGTAVHDRHLGGADIHIGVVDPESGKGGQDVLDRRDADIALDQGRGQPGIADIERGRLDLDGHVQIDPTEDDPRIGSRRPQGQRNLLAGVQADTGRPDHILQGTLLEHRSRSPIASHGGYRHPLPADRRPSVTRRIHAGATVVFHSSCCFAARMRATCR